MYAFKYTFQLILEIFQNQKYLPNQIVKSRKVPNLKSNVKRKEPSLNCRGKKKVERYVPRSESTGADLEVRLINTEESTFYYIGK